MSRHTLAAASVKTRSSAKSAGARRAPVGVLLVLVCALVFALGLGSAPAQAAKIRPAGAFELASPAVVPAAIVEPPASFGEPGSGPGQFGAESPFGVAVQASTGDVFALDQANRRVEEFGPEGKYLSEFNGGGTPAGAFGSEAFGLAVDNSFTSPSAGDVYVTDTGNGVVDRFRPKVGAPNEYEYAGQLTGLSSPTGVAVNSRGDVFVVQLGSQVVLEFGPEGEPVAEITVGDLSFALGVAVAPDGDLYIVNFFGDVVEVVLGPQGEVESESVLDSSPSSAVAVSPEGNVYVAGTEGGAHVAEYDSGGALVEEFGAGNMGVSFGLSFSAFNGDLYAGDLGHQDVHAFAEAEAVGKAKPVVKECTVEAVTPVSAVVSCVVHPHEEAEVYVEYGEVGSATLLKSAAQLVTSNRKVVVGLSGLSPHTKYRFVMVASNAEGSGRSEEAAFKTPGPPLVDGESFSEVGELSFAVSAKLDDEGAAARYHFEYGTSTAYEFSTPEASLAAAPGDQVVGAQIAGLKAGTVYHFRVVVTDVYGPTDGGDLVVRTFPPSVATLPDGRVYEMVSPVEDDVYVPEAGNGPFPVPTMLPFQASADGEAVAYAGAPAAGGNGDAGAGGGNEYLARFTPQGWVSEDEMPSGGGGSPVFLAFSSDLSTGVLESREALAEGAPGGGYDDLYSTSTTSTGGYQPLFTGTPPDRSGEEFASPGTLGPRGAGLAYAGASADFTHLLFEANDALTPPARATPPGVGENDLYESTGGQLSLVNVLPGEQPAPDATFGAPNETGDPADPPDFSHAISADGSRVFWTDLSTGDLYVRENGSRTVQVDAPKGGPGPGGGGRFWTASSDGSRVFFTDDATAGLTSSTRAGSGVNLYEYNVPGEELTDLTAAAHAEVLGVIGVNEVGEDGSYVYFVAEGALAGGATNGKPNLYLLHEGETRFVATLSPADEGTLAYGGAGGSFGDWEPGLGHRTAEVTPDGHSVVFQSVLPLTGYDSEGLSEVFVYDSEEAGGKVLCASCDPSGEPPPVTEVGGVKVKAAAYLPVSWSRTYQPRLISEDGSRVFFDTFEPLVSQDTNGQQDVYGWERDGAGSCQEAGGCISLLSLGTSRTGSYLVDASAGGNDVFFVSDAKLVPQDNNEDDHLYDDRVGGVQPSAPPGCAGTSCGQVPIAPPIFPAPPSATFAGVGNFPPPSPPKAAKPKSLSRAQKLAKALKVCKRKPKRERAGCKKSARRRYGRRK
jgi:hypothetical protein